MSFPCETGPGWDPKHKIPSPYPGADNLDVCMNSILGFKLLHSI